MEQHSDCRHNESQTNLASMSMSFSAEQVQKYRHTLAACLNSNEFKAVELINEFKKVPKLAQLFAMDSRVIENYTIEEHTLMVLNQFHRYLSAAELPEAFPKSAFRLMLALHDIGKPLPESKDEQHKATLEVIDSLRQLLPINDDQLKIAKIIIGSDKIGSYVKTFVRNAPMEDRFVIQQLADQRELGIDDLQEFVSKAETKFELESATSKADKLVSELAIDAQKAGLALDTYFSLLLTYYQSDTAAYTYDAHIPGGKRAYPGLELLYDLNPEFSVTEQRPCLTTGESGFIKFSPVVANALSLVQQKVQDKI